jgi:hypothetical protein
MFTRRVDASVQRALDAEADTRAARRRSPGRCARRLIYNIVKLVMELITVVS